MIAVRLSFRLSGLSVSGELGCNAASHSGLLFMLKVSNERQYCFAQSQFFAFVAVGSVSAAARKWQINTLTQEHIFLRFRLESD